MPTTDHNAAPNDESLMCRFQRSGDPAAFAQLVARFTARGLAVARQIASDRGLAEDAVQEAFLRVLRARDRYDAARPFSTWFFAILRNVCLDMLRRVGREASAMAELAAQAQPYVPAPGEPHEVDRLLAALPPLERAALTLRVTHDLPLADVGAALGISEEAAKKRVQRGLRRLRQKFLHLDPTAGR
ncbi:MAG: sigma-70 family RNA polymerase sigma factor [Phycisphaerae bacterium]|nr:sigma-70 family RNA polymerase sigma factor [Phycisphaerae bacterium]